MSSPSESSTENGAFCNSDRTEVEDYSDDIKGGISVDGRCQKVGHGSTYFDVPMQIENGHVIQILSDEIRRAGESEKRLRRSTITIKMDMEDGFDFDSICRIIFNSRTYRQISNHHVYHWFDREFTYAHFGSQRLKDQFIESVDRNIDNPIRGKIIEASKDGEHITRRPVRIELRGVPGVPTDIKANKITEFIRNSMENLHRKTEEQRMSSNLDVEGQQTKNILQTEIEISDVRAVNRGQGLQKDDLILDANAAGFRHLFLNLNGRIPCSSSHPAAGGKR